MAQAKRALKGKRLSKAVSLLGVAGVSLAGSSSGSIADMPSRNTASFQLLTLGDEEIADVSLATFHLFDHENLRTRRSGIQLAGGCGGCGGCGGSRGCGGCGGCGGGSCLSWGGCSPNC